MRIFDEKRQSIYLIYLLTCNESTTYIQAGQQYIKIQPVVEKEWIWKECLKVPRNSQSVSRCLNSLDLPACNNHASMSLGAADCRLQQTSVSQYALTRQRSIKTPIKDRSVILGSSFAGRNPSTEYKGQGEIRIIQHLIAALYVFFTMSTSTSMYRQHNLSCDMFF